MARRLEAARGAGGLVINADSAVPGRIGELTVRDAAAETAAPAVVRGTPSIEADQFRAILLQKDSVISARDQLISTRTAELVQANARAESLEVQLGTATERAESAEDEVARIKAAQSEPAEVTKVIGGLGSKLAEANEALQGSALPFRLGAVKVDLRGRMTNDGTGIVLGEAARDGSGFSAELFVDRPGLLAGSSAMEAMRRALQTLRSAPRLICHSGRGGQCAADCGRLPAPWNAAASMSGKGDCREFELVRATIRRCGTRRWRAPSAPRRAGRSAAPG
ncbi:hypothetical protein [Mangrovicoccus ximenensis]|uniref:hypothetical protein n=1 Tax=Mangrovicoccus ximenensis TaxID=1911570 RepID=UPI000D331B19|nr:hypothetical protein [Mangrovicoccus ximenensis]